jgi:hypothetical protein
MRTVLALVLVLAPIEARAQLVSTSFDDLQTTLKQGDSIQVTTANGDRLTGNVLAMSASGLELRIKTPRPDASTPAAAQRRLVEDDVPQIRLEHRDGLWNGTLIGLAITAFPGIATIAWGLSAADEGYTTGAEVAGAGLVILGIGAGIGAAVDASIHGHATVYLRLPAPSASRVSVVPLLARTAGGVRVSLHF